jgi:hypothetical protein
MALGALALTAGCSNNSNDAQRLVCEVAQVNAGVPVLSAYLDAGSDKDPCTVDDLAPIDVIPVEFRTRPYNSAVVLAPDGPYSSFQITSYDVIWHPMTAAGDSLTAYNVFGASASAFVPLNDKAEVSVLIADRYLKDRPWFVAALSPCVSGGGGTFTAGCELRFHGHESGSDRDIVIPARITVTFVSYIVE